MVGKLAKLANVKLVSEVPGTLGSRTEFYIYTAHKIGNQKYAVVTTRPKKQGMVRIYIEECNDFEDRRLAKVLLWMSKKPLCINPPYFVESLPAEVILKSNRSAFGIVKDYTLSGWRVDPVLAKLFCADFFVVDSREIDSVKIMPYSANKMVYTNTKTGKTSVALRVGEYMNRASVARLLGYATSDVAFGGTLNGKEFPVYIDEMQEEESTALHNHLLPVLEQGYTNIERGASNVETEFWGSVTWLANPKSDEMAEEHWRFINAIQKLSDNYAAIGSRLSLILYGTRFKVAGRSAQLDSQEEVQLRDEYVSLREMVSVPFTLLFKDKRMLKWLELPHSPEVIKQLRSIASSVGVAIVSELVSGLLENYKHARGLALRLALLNHIKELTDDTLDMDSLLSDAHDSYLFLMSVQFDSFREFVRDLDVAGLMSSWYLGEPQFVQFIIRALAKEDACEVVGLQLGWEDTKGYRRATALRRITDKHLEKYGIDVIKLKSDVVFKSSVPFSKKLKGVVL